MFNFNETELFYDLPPNKTISTVRNNGKKNVKPRVTLALCCNASGSKNLEPIIIGKLKKTRGVNGVEIEKRGIVYAANSNAWMTVIFFEKWLHQFNLRMHGHKVLLLHDNASSQQQQCGVFPPNMTSTIQPLDAGTH